VEFEIEEGCGLGGGGGDVARRVEGNAAGTVLKTCLTMAAHSLLAELATALEVGFKNSEGYT